MRRAYGFLIALQLFACAEDSSSASYERRIEAAQTRVADATCSCLWTDDLVRECRQNAERKITSRCTSELAAQLANEHPAYASCLAENAEKEARCVEEAECPLFGQKCSLDGVEACGPVPADLDEQLTPCLPLFTCKTGQKVPLTLRCNRKQDCFDKSDEAGCDPLID